MSAIQNTFFIIIVSVFVNSSVNAAFGGGGGATDVGNGGAGENKNKCLMMVDFYGQKFCGQKKIIQSPFDQK